MNSSEIFKRNGYILTATLQGKPLNKDIENFRIRNRETLTKWYNGGVKRFIFRPCSAGLIGIDLDSKNGKDGLREFISIAGYDPRKYYHISTPSGGLHIYFFTDNQDYVSLEIRPGLEIKYRAFITLAGSQSDKGRYITQGNPADLQPLPDFLKKIIPIRNANPSPVQQPTCNSLALNKIYEVLNKQGLTPAEGSRNNFAFQFSRYARKQGHRPDEVMNFLSFLQSQNFQATEIQAAVQSAYRGNR